MLCFVLQDQPTDEKAVSVDAASSLSRCLLDTSHVQALCSFCACVLQASCSDVKIAPSEVPSGNLVHAAGQQLVKHPDLCLMNT